MSERLFTALCFAVMPGLFYGIVWVIAKIMVKYPKSGIWLFGAGISIAMFLIGWGAKS